MLTSNQIKFVRENPINIGRVVFMKDSRGPIIYTGQSTDTDSDTDIINLRGLLSLYEIGYDDMSVFNYPCFNETCDLFVFDWGGMSCMSFGGEILEKFSRFLVKSASENFNRKYLIFSDFSQYAVEDAIAEFGKEKPNNIFLSMDDLRREYDLEKGRTFPNL